MALSYNAITGVKIAVHIMMIRIKNTVIKVKTPADLPTSWTPFCISCHCWSASFIPFMISCTAKLIPPVAAAAVAEAAAFPAASFATSFVTSSVTSFATSFGASPIACFASFVTEFTLFPSI